MASGGTIRGSNFPVGSIESASFNKHLSAWNRPMPKSVNGAQSTYSYPAYRGGAREDVVQSLASSSRSDAATRTATSHVSRTSSYAGELMSFSSRRRACIGQETACTVESGTRFASMASSRQERPSSSRGGGFWMPPSGMFAAGFQVADSSRSSSGVQDLVALSHGYAPPPMPMPYGMYPPPPYQAYGGFAPMPYGANSTRSTASRVRFDRAEGWSERGCVVACMAMVAKRDYGEVRKKAVEIADFDGDGMYLRKAKDVLSALGVDAVVRESGASKWSELPDLAIVSVELPDSDGHAVVFRRKDGQAQVLDWHNHGRVPLDTSRYKLNSDRPYVEIT